MELLKPMDLIHYFLCILEAHIERRGRGTLPKPMGRIHCFSAILEELGVRRACGTLLKPMSLTHYFLSISGAQSYEVRAELC